MTYQPAIESYSGKVHEVILGQGDCSLKIGGENTLPWHFFEGSLPNPPRLVMEVSAFKPSSGYGEAVFKDYEKVIGEPDLWAKRYVDELGVEAISFQLADVDAAGKDVSVEERVAVAEKVVGAVSVPVIVYGTGNVAGDKEVLIRVAEVCSGKSLLLGPVKKENYKEIAAACLEHGHGIIAQTSLDVNATKQLNTMLTMAGFPSDKIVIDPLSSALGYGMEYSYSVMERAKLAGLAHNDKMMQMPIIANVGVESWKAKEAGENSTQGVLWEGITALLFMLAGANIVILRSPRTYKLMKGMLSNF